ncbi:MAG TPA: DNA glycosylase [Pseudomonadales bacterium]|nr:DNA glycosylase [Pseudomonadales bacterium]
MKSEIFLPAQDYDLAATLDSGQVFRWRQENGLWRGVVGKNLVRLKQERDSIWAGTDMPVKNWDWLRNFLQTEIDLEMVLRTFPNDEPMNQAVAACRGLRVLRQEPWECLASFILSSTKQIVQIRQIVAHLCECFGEELAGEDAGNLRYAFPSPEKIASVTEADLRRCKMGFRAPNLLATAREIAEGKLDLPALGRLPYAEAREKLMTLRGVGGKIADCVLLFAYGFDSAFPVDVWVERALQTLYFPKRRASEKRLRHLAATHFGPHAGYTQQYLFHYMRTKKKQ